LRGISNSALFLSPKSYKSGILRESRRSFAPKGITTTSPKIPNNKDIKYKNIRKIAFWYTFLASMLNKTKLQIKRKTVEKLITIIIRSCAFCVIWNLFRIEECKQYHIVILTTPYKTNTIKNKSLEILNLLILLVLTSKFFSTGSIYSPPFQKNINLFSRIHKYKIQESNFTIVTTG